jgi:peroxiredoxin
MSKLTLTQQLADFKAGVVQRAPPERVAMMENATAQLKSSGIEQQALGVDDNVPDISLPNATGQMVSLASLWQRGFLVLTFYRGGWCPYCNLELKAWQENLDLLRSLGASLAAISPQTPDNSLSTAEKNQLLYPVLSDTHLQAATAFGIAFEMPQELIELYRSIGNDLPVLNGNGRWALPLPATYVIGRDGRVLYAHIEADYRERAEPSEVIAAVRQANNDLK